MSSRLAGGACAVRSSSGVYPRWLSFVLPASGVQRVPAIGFLLRFVVRWIPISKGFRCARTTVAFCHLYLRVIAADVAR